QAASTPWDQSSNHINDYIVRGHRDLLRKDELPSGREAPANRAAGISSAGASPSEERSLPRRSLEPALSLTTTAAQNVAHIEAVRVPKRPSASSLRPAVKNRVLVLPAFPPLPKPNAHKPSIVIGRSWE